MPAPLTTEEFLQLVRRSELIPQPRLDSFVAQAMEASAAITPRELARLLIAAGLVTNFQADQFLQGKWRGFTIGKYRVLERLGSGGMGTVYLCEHMQVRRKVAIKVLPTSQASNPSALGRFYREGRAAGGMDHPNLVKAHDIDQDDTGLHFLVMDYVDGVSLQQLVSRFGALTPLRAAHYILQCAQGLHHAFLQAGLLHRDIKPANIMLERNGMIRVLDLGLARFYHDNTDDLTQKYDDQNVLGTADYVSPEQALNSHEVDIRTDIYSLGATFYFLLTGQPPFPEGRIAQKLIWHQVRQPTPVNQIRPEVPDGLSAIVEKMMAKNRAQRFQTPAEVIEALLPWTSEPIAPPSDDEMPKLSPAVAPTVPATVNMSVTTAARGPAKPLRPSDHPPAAPMRPSQHAPAAGPSRPPLPPPAAGPKRAPLPPPATVFRTRASERGERVATMNSAPEVDNVATPRVLASPLRPTDIDQMRPTLIVTPPEPIQCVPAQQTAVEVGKQPSKTEAAMRMVLLATVSVLVGMALSWVIIRA